MHNRNVVAKVLVLIVLANIACLNSHISTYSRPIIHHKRDEIAHLALDIITNKKMINNLTKKETETETETDAAQREKEKDYIFFRYEEPFSSDYFFDVKFFANSKYFMTRRLVDSDSDSEDSIINNYGNDTDTSVIENSVLVHGKEESAECMDVKRVVCDLGPDQNFERWIKHFPHFAELAFPCFSVLRRFPPHVKKYVQMPIGKPVPRRIFGWSTAIVSAMKKSGIKFMEQNENENDGESTKNYKKCQWKVLIPKIPYEFPEQQNYFENGKNKTVVLHPNHPNLKWKRRPFLGYFASHSDMVSIQRAVLGSQFKSGVSRDFTIKVLVLNRGGYSRRMQKGSEIAEAIERSIFGQKEYVEVTYLNDMTDYMRPYTQALTIHSADIIISPHGAHLTNLAFMKPCTVVAEIYPNGYFIDFFQPYIITAHGISYQGYENERIPLIDNLGLNTEREQRGIRRSKPLHISVESIINALPKFILDFQTCRTNY